MRESDLTRKIKLALEKEGGFWFKTHGGMFQMAGLPDLIGCYRGIFYGLEVKLPGRERALTKRQAEVLKKIRAVGGVGEVVTSVEQALSVLRF